MSVVVPGRCWNTAVYWTGTGTHYGLLGPFAEGDFIRRVTLSVTADGADRGRFAASLGRSGEATAEAHGAGVPLIQRSPYSLDGIPQMLWAVPAGGQFYFTLPLGISGDVGSRYVVFVIVTTAGSVLAGCVVGAEVLRIEREPRGKGPG